MKVIISGLCGHMGQNVYALCKNGFRGMEAVAGVDLCANDFSGDIPCYCSFDEVNTACDIVVDFSHHSQTASLLKFGIEKNIPVVIATTGQTDEEYKAIEDASKKIPIFFASNFSVGIALLAELAVKTAKAFPDAEIEIIEKHHSRKLDAPSGTALSLAEAITEGARPDAHNLCGRSGYGKRDVKEIGIHSVRMGNIVGEHEIMIGTQNQTITLKHEAHSRALFAEGALAAADFMKNKGAGLYGMNSLLGK